MVNSVVHGASGPDVRFSLGMANSGNLVDILNPQPDQISDQDIIRGLSRLPRYNGQTNLDVMWTVADHLLVCDRVASVIYPLLYRRDPHFRRAVLLHDATEYLTGDNPSPLKSAFASMGIRDGYNKLVARIDQAVFTKFGLPFEVLDDHPYVTSIHHTEVKQVDEVALMVESIHLRPDYTLRYGDTGSLEAQARSKEKWLRGMITFPGPIDSTFMRTSRFEQHWQSVMGLDVQLASPCPQPTAAVPIPISSIKRPPIAGL